MNGREQESTRVEQAKTIAKESALEVEEEDKNFSEESRQVERVRARRRRERQREREIQRQRERQQNNDMMTESVVLMSLWPHAINILISN